MMKLTFDKTPENFPPFVTAPSSPASLTPQTYTDPIFYHSAPTSPYINNENATVFYVDRFNPNPYSISLRIHPTTENLNDFEFETSKILLNNNQDGGTDKETERHLQHERVSFSSWASLDSDHFYEDKSLSLKLPPRLQIPDKNKHKSSSINQGLLNSTRTSSLRQPPPKPTEFDPFMAALQKVMEEEIGRRSNARNYDGNHRRARSHSPTRYSDFENENNDHLSSNLTSLPEDPKGLKYARYVRSQTNKSTSNVVVEEDNAKSSSAIITESKMQKIKGILSKYATFGRQSKRKKGKTEKVKGKHRSMVLVKLKPVFCTGYAVRHT